MNPTSTRSNPVHPITKRIPGNRTPRERLIRMLRLDDDPRSDVSAPPTNAPARYAIVFGKQYAGKTTFIQQTMQDAGLPSSQKLESTRTFDPRSSVGYNLDQIIEMCLASKKKDKGVNLFTRWLCRDPIPGRVIELDLDTSQSAQAIQTRRSILELIQHFEKGQTPPPPHASRIIFSCVGDPSAARAFCSRLSRVSWGQPRIPYYHLADSCRETSQNTLDSSKDSTTRNEDRPILSGEKAVLNILSGCPKLAETVYQCARSNPFRFSREVLADTWSTLPLFGFGSSGCDQTDMDNIAILSETVSFADMAMNGMQAWSGCVSEDTRLAALWWSSHSIGTTMRALANDANEKGICSLAVIGARVRKEYKLRFSSKPAINLVDSFRRHKGQILSKYSIGPKKKQRVSLSRSHSKETPTQNLQPSADRFVRQAPDGDAHLPWVEK